MLPFDQKGLFWTLMDIVCQFMVGMVIFGTKTAIFHRKERFFISKITIFGNFAKPGALGF